MPRNGAGNYSLPQAPFVPSTTISSSAVNSDLSDIANALTASIANDGQTPITGPLKFPSGSAGAPAVTFSADTGAGVYFAGTGQVGVAAGGIAGLLVNTTDPNNQAIQMPSGAIIQPIGVIHDFAGSTAPAGWQLCFGQAISRASFPELFNVIGTTYGAGDGVTTFNLPDCRGFVMAGLDNMGGTPANRLTGFNGLGTNGGEQTHTLVTGEIPSHQHSVFLKDPNHSHAAAGVGNNFLVSNSGTTQLIGGNSVNINTQANTATAATGLTIGSVNGVANDNQTAVAGGGSAHNNVQPTIAFNKIIFAGR